MRSSKKLLTRGRRACATATVALAVSGLTGTAFVPLAPPAYAASADSEIYESPKRIGNGSPSPKPKAAAWLVANVDTGEVLVSHGENVVASPASVQKLLTALALIDEFPNLKKKHKIKESDVEVDGTRVGLLRGNKYTLDMLFHAMLMSSANDAAHALGEAVGGQDWALELMRAKAQELGMDSTVAGTTTGLDARGQGTTVVDLLKLTHEFVKNPYLMKVVRTKTKVLPGGYDYDKKEKAKGFQFQNHTKLFDLVDGAIGLKNGYTEKARGSFVGVAKRGNTTYAAIVLRANNMSRESAADLLNWAFNQKHPKITDTITFTEPSPTPTATPSATATATPTAAPSSVAQSSLGTPPKVGLALGLPVAVFALAGGWFMFRSRSRRGDARSRPEDD